MGDPVFVNIDDDAYPVYTAERGTENGSQFILEIWMRL